MGAKVTVVPSVPLKLLPWIRLNLNFPLPGFTIYIVRKISFDSRLGGSLAVKKLVVILTIRLPIITIYYHSLFAESYDTSLVNV